MNTIYIGVDFHARQQTICYLTTETGELVTAALKRDASKIKNHSWTQSVQRAVATWSVISMRIFPGILDPQSLTRSLPLLY